mmetsp:Transcript_6735/g.17257  ORF Transcript_6735/g.17257 Transcript_6735/m.17257 type:complete len:288 (+) Transcript_6735:632-1495(+)
MVRGPRPDVVAHDGEARHGTPVLLGEVALHGAVRAAERAHLAVVVPHPRLQVVGVRAHGGHAGGGGALQHLAFGLADLAVAFGVVPHEHQAVGGAGPHSWRRSGGGGGEGQDALHGAVVVPAGAQHLAVHAPDAHLEVRAARDHKLAPHLAHCVHALVVRHEGLHLLLPRGDVEHAEVPAGAAHPQVGAPHHAHAVHRLVALPLHEHLALAVGRGPRAQRPVGVPREHRSGRGRGASRVHRPEVSHEREVQGRGGGGVGLRRALLGDVHDDSGGDSSGGGRRGGVRG